ncbi:MAG: RNA polymerase sigma factor [Sandaracinaceae bacterium]
MVGGPESEIQRALAADDLEAAATHAMRGYGPEVLGWLAATTGDLTLADEAFSQLAEDLWKSLGGYRGEASFRTWMYVLARNALHRVRRMTQPAREELLSGISEVAQRLRSETRPWQQTAVKDRFAALREALDESSQSLLILRVDRGMKWDEIALILDEPGDPKTASARVRKRFSALKAKLVKMAADSGLTTSV